jgi:nicotinic acid mononucleotide adenylyltransferase
MAQHNSINFLFGTNRSDEMQKSKVTVGTAALIDYYNYQMSRQRNNIDKYDINTVQSTATTNCTEYTFCLGSDAFFDLTAGKWKESQRILQILQGRLLVLLREKSSSKPVTVSQCTTTETATSEQLNTHHHNDDIDEKVNSNQLLLQRIQARIDETCPNAKVLEIDHLDDISSSMVRQCPADINIWSTMISPSVLQYIQEHRLYQFKDK